VRKKKHGWNIRRRGHSWQVDCGTVNGKRKQKSFKTKEEAKDWARQQKDDVDNNRAAAFELDDAHRMDTLKAYQRLAAGLGTQVADLPRDGASLDAAVVVFLRHSVPKVQQRTFGQLATEYIDAKIGANRRPDTILDIRHRILKIASDFEKTPVHLISTAALQGWLDKSGYKGTTSRNFRTHLVMFFNYAKKRKLLTENPAYDIEKAAVDEKMPGILTVDECERLMHAAEEHAPEMVPNFAISLFAGLRPTEVCQIDWSTINFDARRIKVIPADAKRRSLRHVDMSDNLLAWLAAHRRQSGLVHFSRKESEKVRREAKVKWCSDVLRHSYASYHLAMHENAALTSLQLGHRNTGLLFNNYRDLVTREDAQRFWKITPSQEANVIRIAAAG